MPGLSLTRDLVARAHRVVPDPGPPAGYTLATDGEVAAHVGRVLEQRPEGPLWVFAYGSLLWKPVFAPVRQLRASAPGWHRQFAIEIDGFRGTPEVPGLMMALISGGRCIGVAQEVAEDQAAATLEALIRREMPFVDFFDALRWIALETAEGPKRALVFWANPTGVKLRRGLPLDQAARMLARACGHGGSGAEYLHETVTALEAQGIRDRNLWTLQELVAAELAAL